MRVPTNITPRTQRPTGEVPFVQNRAGAAAASGAQLGNQLVQAGNTLGSVGGLLRQQATQAQRFGVMQNFSAFQTSVDEKMVELKRNADPAQGNFADQATAAYSNWEADWLDTVPDDFYDEFATRAADVKSSIARDALAFQYERTDAFFRQGVNDQLNVSLQALDQDGSIVNLDAQRRNIDEFIDATALTEAEKLSLRRQAYRAIEGVSYKSEVRRGNLDMGALGVGSAPGEAVDLLLEFDGSSLENGLDYETNRELLGERVKEAEAAAVEGVGSLDRWAALPSRARGALISLVDDLGGLPASVKQAIDSGDLNEVAQAVADLSGTDDDRRAVEAKIILGTEQMPEGMLDADPRFANIPYEDRLALRADAEREAAAQQTADQAAALAQQKSAINDLELNLMDGAAGQYEIDQAREAGWLTDASDVKRLQNIIKEQNEGLVAVQQIQAMVNAGMTGNPADEEFRKAFNAYVGTGGEAALRQRDQTFVRDYLVPAVRTLGDLPTSATGLLGAMIRSQDSEQALFALDTLAQLEQASPEAYNARVSEEVQADVEYWRGIKDYYAADAVLEAVRGGNTQEARTRTTMLRKEAETLIADGDVEINLRQTLAPNGWFQGDAAMVAGTDDLLQRDFNQIFEREYAREGNLERAKQNTLTAMGKVWKVSEAGGQRLLMKYPPEVTYPKWNDSHDWLTEQGLAELRANAPGREIENFQLITDEQTISEFQEGRTGGSSGPSYVVIYPDPETGQLRVPTVKRPGAGGELFDTGVPLRLSFQITPEMEAAKAADFATKQENLAYETAIETFQNAQRHSLHTGVPIPEEVQQAYDDAVAAQGAPRSTMTVFGNYGTR